MLCEPDHEHILHCIQSAARVSIGAATLLEAGIVLSSRLGEDARGRLGRLMHEGAIDVLPVTDAHYAVAMGAWLRFGKGRHPAALNYGDCLSYAMAVVANEPLLCVGDDFPQTDCALA